jgi:hypothetical protein
MLGSRSAADRGTNLDQRAVRCANVRHDLAPGLGRRRCQLGSAVRQRALVSGGNLVGDQSDLHAQRLRRNVGSDVAARKIHVPEFVRCKSQRGVAGVELTIGARLVQELSPQAEGRFEERERVADTRDVDDGVAQLHAHSFGGPARSDRP